MIVILTTLSSQLLDHHAKQEAEVVRKVHEAIAHERVRQCASPFHKSPVKDCPECGMDLQSEVLRDK
jgi:hypothetical protein